MITTEDCVNLMHAMIWKTLGSDADYALSGVTCNLPMLAAKCGIRKYGNKFVFEILYNEGINWHAVDRDDLLDNANIFKSVLSDFKREIERKRESSKEEERKQKEKEDRRTQTYLNLVSEYFP